MGRRAKQDRPPKSSTLSQIDFRDGLLGTIACSRNHRIRDFDRRTFDGQHTIHMPDSGHFLGNSRSPTIDVVTLSLLAAPAGSQYADNLPFVTSASDTCGYRRVGTSQDQTDTSRARIMARYVLLASMVIGSFSSVSAQQPADSVAVPAAQAQRALGAPRTPNASSDPVYDVISLNNASLIDVIDVLARRLKINYVLDPRVQGGITLNTYGETKNFDSRSLLDSILQINGYGIVKQGDIYRIVPIGDTSHLSIMPEKRENANLIPDDDGTMLNLVFVKYLSADELLKVLNPFLGTNAKAFTYLPANLMLILDSRRNMRRLLELVSLFDDEKLTQGRVRIFSVNSAKPSDLVKELEEIIKPVFLAANFAPIMLLPIDRIRAIVAIAQNPATFPELEKWLLKLDIPTAEKPDTKTIHVYRVKYGEATELADAVMTLYSDARPASPTTRSRPYPSNQSINPSGSGISTPVAITPGQGSLENGSANQRGPGIPAAGTVDANDLTGTYLGTAYSRTLQPNAPRVVPRQTTNSLIIQAVRTDYENIRKLLEELDVPPRQVLIEAKIYEVDLTASFASSVGTTLQQVAQSSVHQFLGNLSGSTTNLSIGTLVGRSRELLAAVQLQESENRAKVISAPSLIATDSIAASMNVGTTVPTLSAQAVTGAQQNGTSLFANSIVNQDSGITLSVMAHVNAGGIVTMEINQQISTPIPPSTGGIQSPSFSNRSIQTRVTVQDGDTIAIGGIIDEQSTYTTSGIPLLNRIPVIGAVFGSRSYNKERTELIVFITPKVIYDTNGISEATEELKQQLKHLSRFAKMEQ